jgi:hypothetical protein
MLGVNGRWDFNLSHFLLSVPAMFCGLCVIKHCPDLYASFAFSEMNLTSRIVFAAVKYNAFVVSHELFFCVQGRNELWKNR